MRATGPRCSSTSYGHRASELAARRGGAPPRRAARARGRSARRSSRAAARREDLGELADTADEPGDACAGRLAQAVASLHALAADRERLEAEAVEAEALRRTDAVKTAVIQSVSHDLRTPLATIEAALDGLERDGAWTSGRRRAPQTLRHELDRLEAVRREHARPLAPAGRRGHTPPALWPIDELAAQALDELRRRRARARRVPAELPPSAPTPRRSSARSRTCSRTRSSSRRPAPRSSLRADVAATRSCSGRGPRAGRRGRRGGHDLRAVPHGAGSGGAGSGSRSRAASSTANGGASASSGARRAARRSSSSFRAEQPGAVVMRPLLVVDDEPRVPARPRDESPRRRLRGRDRGDGRGALAAARRPDRRGRPRPGAARRARHGRLRGAARADDVPIVVVSAVGEERRRSPRSTPAPTTT